MTPGAASAGWRFGGALRACAEGAWRGLALLHSAAVAQASRRRGQSSGRSFARNGRMALAAPALLSDPFSYPGLGFPLCFMLFLRLCFVMRSAWLLLVLVLWLRLSCLPAVDPTAAALAAATGGGAVAALPRVGLHLCPCTRYVAVMSPLEVLEA